MAEWKPISEIFDFEKGSLQSSKNTAGEYSFITAAVDWKTHNQFTHDCEALIFAMGASGSLGRTHYAKGKFIASDLCFILQPKNGLKLNLRFYHRLFNFLRDDIVKKTATGTSKLAINKENFSKYKLPYFGYEHQIAFKDKIENIYKSKLEILIELEKQESHLKQLRQAILQEAVEGILTAEWRKQNPELISGENHAARLMEKIKAEKERLINEGKIKKQKPLRPISENEKPFHLPEEWVWTRFQEITTLITDGKHGDCQNQPNSGYYFLSAKDIQNENLIYDYARQINKAEFEEVHRRTNLIPGDICMVNTGATVGKLAIAPESTRTFKTTFQKSVAIIKLIQSHTINRYIKYFLNYEVKE